MRRGYSDEEAAGLLDLFGPRERWSTTLHNFQWLQTSAMVQGFTGGTQATLPLECTYDFEVAASRLLNALRDGHLPLRLLFNGSFFVRGESGMQVVPVPWDLDAEFALPVATWRSMMDACFGGTAAEIDALRVMVMSLELV